MIREYIIKVDEDKKDIMGNCPLIEKPKELIRCKDCKYAIPSSENFIMCTAPYESQYPKAYKPIDWFCKGGERKDGCEE